MPDRFLHRGLPTSPSLPSWYEDLRANIDIRSYDTDKLERFKRTLRYSPEDAVGQLRMSYQRHKRQRIDPELFALCSAVAELFSRAPDSVDEYDGRSITLDLWATLLMSNLVLVYRTMMFAHDFMQEFPDWIDVVLVGFSGIVGAFAPSNNQRLDFRGIDVYSDTNALLWYARGFFEVLVKDHGRLLDGERLSGLLLGRGMEEHCLPGCGERLRGSVVDLLKKFFPLFAQSARQPMVSQTNIPFVALLCWHATPETHPQVKTFLTYAATYIQLAKRPFDGIMTVGAFDVYESSATIHRFYDGSVAARILVALQSHHMLDGPLQVMLRDLGSFLLDYLSSSSDSCKGSPSSISKKAVKCLHDALLRQDTFGSLQYTSSIFFAGISLLQYTKTSFGEVVSTDLYTEEESVVVWILARALVLCVENNCKYHELFTNSLSLYRAAAVQRTKNLVLINQRKAVRQEWYPTLEQLNDKKLGGRAALAPEFEMLVEEWRAFGAAFGLDEEEEKDRCFPDLQKRCAWKECKWHTKTHTDIREVVCPGCKTKRYCDVLCRRRDWRSGGHDEKCRKTIA